VLRVQGNSTCEFWATLVRGVGRYVGLSKSVAPAQAYLVLAQRSLGGGSAQLIFKSGERSAPDPEMDLCKVKFDVRIYCDKWKREER
jgi:hypothetical protein